MKESVKTITQTDIQFYTMGPIHCIFGHFACKTLHEIMLFTHYHNLLALYHAYVLHNHKIN